MAVLLSVVNVVLAAFFVLYLFLLSFVFCPLLP